MTDDFAFDTALSALSASQSDQAPVAEYQPASLEPITGSAFDEEIEEAGPELIAPANEKEIAPEVAAPPAPSHLPNALRDSVTVHVFRGVGDDGHVDGLIEGLRTAGWDVVAGALPAPATDSVARKRVALGLGLGAAAAMSQAREGTAGAADGVVAVCPFLGFDAPIYRTNKSGISMLKERVFRLARRPQLRAISSRIECVSAYTGLRPFGAQPISWADLADCAPSVSFAALLQPLSCPTTIVLNEREPELDAERAQAQIPAMNALASVSVRSVLGGDLVQAVEHALIALFKPRAESESPPRAAAAEAGAVAV